MIDPVEYGLGGSEFKLLQYFKDNPKVTATKLELSKVLKLLDRSIYKAASNLQYLNIITIEAFIASMAQKSISLLTINCCSICLIGRETNCHMMPYFWTASGEGRTEK